MTILTLAVMAVLAAAPVPSAPQNQDKAEVALKAAMDKEVLDGNLKAAIDQYKKLAQGKDRAVAARALVRMGQCYDKLGDAESRKAYERVVREFGDQKDAVAEARKYLGAKAAGDGAVRVRRLDSDCSMPADDGQTVVCAKDGALIVRNLASRLERRVVEKPAGKLQWLDEFRVSPDGKKVAYTRDYENAADQIRVVAADGSGDRLLLEDADAAWGSMVLHDWSSDSQRLLATKISRKEKRGMQWLLVSVTDGSVRVLGTLEPGRVFSAGRFSPDSKYVVYGVGDPGHPKDIFAMAVEGGDPWILMSHESVNALTGWMPDGRLVFTSDRTGTLDLWSLRVRDGRPDGEPEVIRRDLGKSEPYGIGRDSALYYRLGTVNDEVYTAGLDLSSGRMVSTPSPVATRYVGLSYCPAYSWDGRFLAYGSGPPESHHIRVRTLATGAEREFKSPMASQRYTLKWYPDGSALLIHGRKAGETAKDAGFYRLSLTGGEVTPVLTGLRDDYATNPSFSPDGRYLYFRVVSPLRISRLDLKNGTREDDFLHLAQPDYMRLFALSPDGTRIVFGARKGKLDLDYIGVVSTGGGEPKVTYEYPADELMRGFAGLNWTADGRGILFHRSADNSRGGPESPDDIWFVPADGGVSRKLTSTTGYIIALIAHPNGRDIAWHTRRHQTESWIMENAFGPPRAAK